MTNYPLYLPHYLFLLLIFREVISCFTQFGGSSFCLKFDKFHDVDPCKRHTQTIIFFGLVSME